ncbi:MAG TPA: hypothetical protein VKB38_16875 [Terracidiphilus sp.]|nr:hypothetical protein [Terracidiphilus sp.]
MRIRPSLWHCLWSVPFFLAGGGLFGYTLFHGLMHMTDSLMQVVAPGSTELHLKPGSYTVFLEEQSIVNGRVYSTTQSIDGLACRVNSLSDGSSIPISKSSMNTTYSLNGRSGHSVLEFPIQNEGRYTFACDYGDQASGPQVVVAVGSGVGTAISTTVIGGLAAFFGGGGAGAIVILIVILMREREKKRLRQLAQAQSPPVH